MAVPTVPFTSRTAARGMVCAADQLAASAGVEMLARGGSAADGAVAAAAVMATTSPHLCGLGGDLLAMVHSPGQPPRALLAIGRAGSGSDPDGLRADGHDVMPLRHDIRSVTVPGAVDGWLALHRRFGRLDLETVLAPAVALAEEGFAASGLLAAASLLVAGLPGAEQLCPAGPLQPAQRVRVPGVATALRAIMTEGRDGFYRGEFGRALLDLGRGLFVADDLERDNASWVEPLRSRAWGHDLWTVPAPSQGYLALAGAVIAEQVGLPTDTEDPEWAHLLVEAARAAGHDRPRDLHEDADGAYLLDERRLTEAAARIDPARVAPSDVAGDDRGGDGPTSGVPRLGDGDTTHLCAIDGDRLGISLTESNALDFGAHLVAGSTGIFLHNRGLGFSLQPGHPAELRAGRRPPHTLSPSLVTNPAGSLTQLVGTMGGDGQPQIILQLFARLLHSREDPAAAIAAARFVLDARDAGPFRLWHGRELSVRLEAHAPAGWTEGLRERGHEVRSVRALDPVAVGCAQIVSLEADETVTRADRTGAISGASDPRSPEGAAVAY